MDYYLKLEILKYLVKCSGCNKYDKQNYNMNTCCICKIFYCDKCKYNLIRNYNHYETTSMYCHSCNDYYFNQRIECQ
jgi:hypothetical protein